MRTIHDRRRTPGWPRRRRRRPVAGGAGLLLAAGLLAGSATVATAGTAAAATPVTQTFTSSGSYLVTVPPYTTSMYLAGLGGAGISGQASADNSSAGGAPGSGTNVTETLPIDADYHAGDVLLITVGRDGGGGQGGTGDGIAGDGGSGGGASLVFDETTGVYLMVAAGGGGGGGGSGFLFFNGGRGGTDGDGAQGTFGFGGAKGDNCAGDGRVGIGGQGDSAGNGSSGGGGGGGGGGTCAGHGGQTDTINGGGGGGGGSGNSTTDPSATGPSVTPGTNTGDGSVTVTFTQDLQAPVLTPPGCQYAPDNLGRVDTAGLYGRVSATGVPAPTLALLNAPVWLTTGNVQTTWTGSTYQTSADIVYTPTAPAATGEYTFQVEAYNSQGVTPFAPMTVVAGAGIVKPTFLSLPVATATVGMPFSFHVTEVGCPPPGTYAFVGGTQSVAGLPWLTIDEATGILSGTPPAADIGTHTFTIEVKSTAGTTDFHQAFSLRVSATSPATPIAPTRSQAVPYDRKALVSWEPPIDDGGAPVTSYTVTATDHTTPANGGQTATTAAFPHGNDVFVTGLTNGDDYTFTVAATNKAGTGDASAPSNDVTPFTFPTVPSISSVTPGPGQATVNFNPPLTTDDGKPVVSYTVTATDQTTAANGGQTATGAASPITVTGLTAGDSYTFTVTYTESLGDVVSAPSDPVTPFGVPGAPAVSSATPEAGQARVDFTPPASDGGSPVTGYTVTATDQTTPANGGQTATGAASPITVTGLTNGDSYTFTVTAANAAGAGAGSAPSAPVTPFTVPGTPSVFLVTPGTGQATVDFTPPASDGGSPVTGYTVTATDQTTPANGGQTATGAASPITVTGLTNGDSYTFTVTAANAAGSGSSSPSTPASTAVPIPPGSPSADLSVTVSPQPTAVDGSTFTETVTVTNHGPWPATSVHTGITIPSGLTLIADPGGTKNGPIVSWTAASIGVNSSVTYTITVQVNARASGTVLIAAASASLKVPDPRPLNNAALITVKLG